MDKIGLILVILSAIAVGSCVLAALIVAVGYLFGTGMKRAGALGRGPTGARGATGFPGPTGPSGANGGIIIRAMNEYRGGFPEVDFNDGVPKVKWNMGAATDGDDGPDGKDGEVK